MEGTVLGQDGGQVAEDPAASRRASPSLAEAQGQAQAQDAARTRVVCTARTRDVRGLSGGWVGGVSTPPQAAPGGPA